MPVDGLPLVLENIINSIITENEVDSWILRGFKEYSQLTLKFKMASSGDSMEYSTYKKKPKGQIKRDKRRSDKWKYTENKQVESGTIIGRPNRYEKQDDKSDEKHERDFNSGDQSQEDQGGTPCEESPDDIDMVIPTVGKPSSSEEHASHGNASVDGPGQGSHMNCNMSRPNIDFCDVNKSTDHIDMDNDSSVESMCLNILSDQESDNGKHELLHCDECHVPIYEESGVTWMRCTTCNDHDICWDCWRKGNHREHHSQMTTYTWQNELSNLPQYSCSCCGFLYDHENPLFRVKRCGKCGDFSMCKRCHEKDLNKHHSYIMRSILLSVYSRTLLNG